MMTKITEQQWQQAKEHFDEVFSNYVDLIGEPGVNTTFAITFTFEPLLRRYNEGERTQELFEAMLAVE